jgi:ketosteroid isomerase-like protein
MIGVDRAEHFAAEWIAAWDRHDVDALLARCDDAFEWTSPLLARIAGKSATVLRGKARIGASWARLLTPPALTVAPRFRLRLRSALTGADGLVLLCDLDSRRVAQTIRLGADGRATRLACQHFPLKTGGADMIEADFARHFADDWISAWNRHDLAAILSHYAPDIDMHSPYIAVMANEPGGVLHGKAAVGSYWEKALARMPDLHFALTEVFCGADSLVLHYQGQRGAVAEVFEFGADGKVISAAAHYAHPPENAP